MVNIADELHGVGGGGEGEGEEAEKIRPIVWRGLIIIHASLEKRLGSEL